MRTLKRIIYVYEETIVVKGHYFKYEMTKDTKKNNNNELYTLYDSEKKYEPLVASTVRTYEGLIKIAEAYLTGDKQTLADAKYKNCIIY